LSIVGKRKDNKSKEAQTGMPRIRRVVWRFPVAGEMENQRLPTAHRAVFRRFPPFSTVFAISRSYVSGESRSRANTAAATSSSLQLLKRSD